MRATHQNLAALAVCFYLAALTGCAATAESSAAALGKLFGRKTPEQRLNIKTPADRAKELAELADSAASKSPEEQSRIAQELAEEIRDENDPVMRRHILRTLSAYHTPVSLNILIAGIKDSDLEVRRVACESLGRHGGPQSVPELARVAMADADVDVRIAAVRALGDTREKLALAPLADVLADPDPAIQFRSREALRKLSGRDYGNNATAWREYAKTGNSNAPEVSIAERWRESIF